MYAYVFETPIPADAEMMRKYTVAPHPFVIEPHELGRIAIGKGKGKYELVEVAQDVPVLTAPISPSSLTGEGNGEGEGGPSDEKYHLPRRDDRVKPSFAFCQQ